MRLDINGVTSQQIIWNSLAVEQNLTSLVDTAHFKYRKFGSRTYLPVIGDDIEIYDGSTKIFGGEIVTINESVGNNADGLIYAVDCADYSFKLGNILVSETYENMTIAAIIADLIGTYAPGYTADNVSGSFLVGKIVFNQVPLSQCLMKLAGIVQYEWYVDENKDLNFFPKFTNGAPYNLTDTNGNFISGSLMRKIDGSQIVNQVKVRGGEYDGQLYTDTITVKGNDSKTFKLPYRFSNLGIQVDTGSGFVTKVVGIDFIDDFTTKDILYNYNDFTIKFNSTLADGNKIKFSGNPKVRVLAVASDAASIATYSLREKIIRDDSIADLTVARKRAIAELQTYKDQLDEVTFDTYTPGLRSGQVINLTSAKRGANVNYIISRVEFRAWKPDTFYYHATLVSSRKYYLNDVLQKLLTPDPIQAAEGEVAEKITTDIKEISVTEMIEKLTGENDDATVTVAADVEKDPLGAGVEPTWVLGPYFPSSITDTKRVGLLNLSLKFY